jgi:hypothetical protein
MVVFSVTDSNDFMSRHSESAYRDVKSGRLVDSGRQRHHCTAIKDHMDLESKLADHLEHDPAVRIAGRDHHGALFQGRNAPLAQSFCK